MRKSDIFVTIIVAAIGTIVAFFLVNTLLGDPDERYETYKTITPISSDVVLPDANVFNPTAVNPTIEIYVGNCEDTDGNGVLSKAELVACGRISSTEEEVEEEETDETKESDTYEDEITDDTEYSEEEFVFEIDYGEGV